MATFAVTREQVLAHRVVAQGLDRAGSIDADELSIWDLGVQESPAGSAVLTLAARLPGGGDDVPDLTDQQRFTTVWATRGALVVLRAGEVRTFAAALWPLDQADAVSRLAGNGQHLRKADLDAMDALRVTAEAMAGVVTEPMTKGEVSTEVSAIIPDEYVAWCRGCQAHHLGDQLMRLAGLPAGLRLVPGATPATLEPIPRWGEVVHRAVGTEALVRAYLQLYGPTSATDVGGFFQTSGKAMASAWPDGLTEVSVAGRKTWVPDEDLDALRTATPMSGEVRLLPRSDPWLLARDRDLTVPDPAVRKVLWPALGWPGAVLVDGEVAAAWRVKGFGSKATMTVEAFTDLAATTRTKIAAESAAVARQRSVEEIPITYE